MEEKQNQENQVEEKKLNETLRNVLIAVLICAVFVAVISLGIWSANKSNNSSELEETMDKLSTIKYTLGDTFILNGLEFKLGTADDIVWTKVNNEYVEQNGADVAVLPVTIRNLESSPKLLDLIYLTYISDGRYINPVGFLFGESDIKSIDVISENESINTAFHVLYDGDDEYRVSFHSQDDSVAVLIDFQIAKPDITPESETEPATELPETTPLVQTYSSGKYKVGVDIPAGEYFLQATAERGGYFSVTSDSNGDNILENEGFENQHYITIQDGQYLELKRITALSVNDMSKIFDASNLEEGMYRVGIDIPAGEYRLNAIVERGGYVCIYDNSTVNRKIQSNNVFEANDYVTVAYGQYLQIKRCIASIVQ